MPRKGYKCITINEKLHEEVKRRAKQSNLTIKDYIEHLLSLNNADKKEK